MNELVVKRIKEVMGDASQADFAKTIGSSQSVISKICSGTAPSFNVIVSIAKKYGVSTDWLLGLSDKKSLAGYSTFDDTKPTTYADVAGLLARLLKSKSIRYYRNEKTHSSYGVIPGLDGNSYYDELIIDDCFIGDLINSASTLSSTNPETVEAWLKKVVEDYDIPLMEWKEWSERQYAMEKMTRTSLEILKKFDKEERGK